MEDSVACHINQEEIYQAEYRNDHSGIWYWTKPNFSLVSNDKNGIYGFELQFISHIICGYIEVRFDNGEQRKYSLSIGLQKITARSTQIFSTAKISVNPWYKREGDPRSLGICLREVRISKVKSILNDDDRLVHLHIPKCAGTSMDSMFTNRYGPNESIRVHLNFPSINGGANHYSDSQLLDYHYISGHFSSALPVRLGLLHRTYTVLRDPVERAVSHYHHARKTGADDPLSVLCRENSLEELFLTKNINKAKAAGLTNLITYTLSGGIPEWTIKHQGIDDESILETAKATLDGMLSVGFIENLSGFIKSIKSKLGIHLDQKIPELNKGEHSSPTLPIHLRNAIEDANYLDMELYSWALSRSSSTFNKNQDHNN